MKSPPRAGVFYLWTDSVTAQALAAGNREALSGTRLQLLEQRPIGNWEPGKTLVRVALSGPEAAEVRRQEQLLSDGGIVGYFVAPDLLTTAYMNVVEMAKKD